MNKTTYTLTIDAEIASLVNKVKQVKTAMDQIGGSGKVSGATEAFASIEKSLDQLKEKAATPITSNAAFSGMTKDITRVKTALASLEGEMTNISSSSNAEKMRFLPDGTADKITKANSALSQYASTMQQASAKSQALVNAEKGYAAALKTQAEMQSKVNTKQTLVNSAKAAVKASQDEKAAIEQKIAVLQKWQATQESFSQSGDKRTKEYQQPKREAEAVGSGMGVDVKDAQQVTNAIQQLNTELADHDNAIKAAEADVKTTSNSLNTYQSKLKEAKVATDLAEQSLQEANNTFEQNKATKAADAYKQLKDAAQQLGITLSDDQMEYSEQNAEQLRIALQQLESQGMEQVETACTQLKQEISSLGTEVDNTENKVENGREAFQKMDETASDVSAFASRIKSFIGLQGAAMAMRRALTDAFETVKALDAAMVEMSVVTDKSVSDYWEELPEYTERATEMGLTIEDVYKADTLYYQQGLKKNEVMAISNQTMKMARISGLETAEATDRMTAALRGFNMELNEANAQNIADVYSKLAAITASDVDEISSAMTKTASIASSAGMEFETTAAFLSQIIETTRESAETAGTALKTVIARFQELKKDPSEIGEVDGEIIDANKIETALRSVGVALRDSSGQFRELDDVFLELASKWDGLDTNTQRYIATIAAGSRQQSRFIAMMSDYGRTQELVTAANSAAGASNEQFGKTMDGIEAKLNKLKTAWDNFVMDITNSELLKAGVDLLTWFIEKIDWLTDLLGNFSGGAKIALIVGALMLADKALKIFLNTLLTVDAAGKRTNGIFASLGAVVKSAGTSAANGFKKVSASLTNLSNRAKAARTQMKVVIPPEALAQQQAYQTALQKEQAIDAKRYQAKLKLNALEKQGMQNTAQYQALQARYNATQGISTAATQQRAGAEAALFAAMELNEQQQEEANAMVSMGIGADTAAMLAKAGVTAVTVAEAAAKDDLTESEAAANLAAQAGTKTTLGQTVGKLLNNLAIKMGAKETLAETKAKGGNTAATWLQTAANWAMQASMWPILLIGLAIIAAIALLVVGILLLVAAFKKAQANSPEGKLKSAQASAESAAQAAEETAEAYKNLSDAFDSLSGKYDALEELTKGTKAWNDAVREINQEVMALIDQYPELANLVKSKDGVMHIDLDSEGAQAVLDDYNKRAIKAASSAAVMKAAVSEAQTAVDYKGLSNDAKIGNETALGWQTAGGIALIASGVGVLGVPHPGATAGGAGLIGAGIATITNAEDKRAENKVNTEKFAEAMGEGWIAQVGDEWKVVNEEMVSELGLTADDIRKFGEELGDGAEELNTYAQSVVKAKTDQDIANQSIANSALMVADTARMTVEAIKQLETAATGDYASYFNEKEYEKVKKEAEAATSGGSGGDTDDAGREEYYRKKAGEIYGEGTKVKFKDGKVIVGSGDNEKEYSEEAFQKIIASSQAIDTAASALENLPKAMTKATKVTTEKFGKTAGDSIAKAYAGAEGGAMTRSDIEALTKMSKGDFYNIFNSLSSAEQEAFGGVENFINQLTSTADLASQAFYDANKQMQEMGISVNYNMGMTADAVKGYASQLETIAILAGQEGVDAVNASLNSLVSGLEENELAIFMSELNALDWTNQDSWENFPQQLAELGLSLPANELENFINLTSDSANAVKNIDFEKLSDGLKTVAKTLKDIRGGIGGRVISSEVYEIMLEINPEIATSFMETLDGEFLYLGNTMNTLIDVIEENTTVWAEKRNTGLSTQVGAAEVMDFLDKSYTWGNVALDITDWKSWDQDTYLKTSSGNYLKMFIEEATKRGLNLEELGIDNLSNTTDVDKLEKSPKKMEQVMSELAGVFVNWGQNVEKLTEAMVSDITTIYMATRSISDNASAAIGFRTRLQNGEKLTEEEWVQYKASTATIQTQAYEAGVNQVDYENYTKVLNEVNKLDEAYKNGIITLAQYRKKYAQILPDLQRYEAAITGITAIENMETRFATTLEKISGSVEELANLGDGEITKKMNTIGQAVSAFGIQVTEENYQALESLLTTMLEGGKEGMEAFAQILDASAAKYGLTNTQFLTIEGQKFEEMTDKQIAYADAMIAAGVATWKVATDGTKEFIWTTGEFYERMLEESDAKTEKWVSTFDRMFNLNEALNGTIRERERAEKAYSRALANNCASAQDMADIMAQQLLLLNQEAFAQSEIAAQAMATIQSLAAENTEFSQYYKFDATSGVLTINYEALDAAGLSEEDGGRFETFISSIQDQTGIYQDSLNAIEDIEDSVDSIKNQGRESLSSLYDQVKEGLVAGREQEIALMEETNEAITEAASKLLDGLQAVVDEARQIRDNMKTEDEIADKEAQLAFLRRDTSGANALQIAELEKSLAEDKQSYSDSLVDQSIERLQDENDKAAEQREQQIEIARQSLDAYLSSSALWNEVKTIVDTGLQAVADGQKFADTEAGYLAGIAGDINSLNPIAREDFVEELEKAAQEGAIYAGFVEISKAIGGTESPVTISELGTAVTTAIGLNKSAINNIATDIGTLGNTSIPNALGDASKAIIEGLDDGGYTQAMASNIASILAEIRGKTQDSTSGGEEGSVPPGVVNSYTNTVISNYGPGGSTTNRNTLGGVNTGTGVANRYTSTTTSNSQTVAGIKDDVVKNSPGGVIDNKNIYTTYDGASYYAGDGSSLVTSSTSKTDLGTGGTVSNTEDNPPKLSTLKGHPVLDQKVSTMVASTQQTAKKTIVDANLYVTDPLGTGYTLLNSLFDPPVDGFYEWVPYKDVKYVEGTRRSDGTYTGSYYYVPKGTPIYKGYKTGGLADYTGPAWLDGTKQRPELVLNQTDTQNFIALKDILADAMSADYSKSDNKGGGDNYFEIEINVEQLNDDYDVEQIADKIRSMIYEDSTYRNVNAINLIR